MSGDTLYVTPVDIVPMKDRELNEVRKHFGLLFQSAALLDWLSVYENVAFPPRDRGGELRDRVLDIYAFFVGRIKGSANSYQQIL